MKQPTAVVSIFATIIAYSFLAAWYLAPTPESIIADQLRESMQVLELNVRWVAIFKPNDTPAEVRVIKDGLGPFALFEFDPARIAGKSPEELRFYAAHEAGHLMTVCSMQPTILQAQMCADRMAALVMGYDRAIKVMRRYETYQLRARAVALERTFKGVTRRGP